MQRREAASKIPKHNVFYKRRMEENPYIFVYFFSNHRNLCSRIGVIYSGT